MFCASQAATAITLTMEGAPSSSSPSSSSSALASSSSTAHLGSGSRAIDRHNPIIRDARRLARSLPRPPPCASQTPPVDPVPYSLLRQKGGATGSPVQSNNNDSRAAKKKKNKESSAAAKPSESYGNGVAGERKSVLANNKAGDFSSPAASTRYLLGTETAFLDVLTDFGPALALNSVDNSKLKKDDSSSVSDSKPPPPSRSQDQVVVLRVSLHCKGCEGKIRKHISRMQGVTSFSIDSVAKKVTVVGDVTPLGVLASISKVKTAKLWTPAPSSASETKKSKALAAA